MVGGSGEKVRGALTHSYDLLLQPLLHTAGPSLSPTGTQHCVKEHSMTRNTDYWNVSGPWTHVCMHACAHEHVCSCSVPRPIGKATTVWIWVFKGIHWSCIPESLTSRSRLMRIIGTDVSKLALETVSWACSYSPSWVPATRGYAGYYHLTWFLLFLVFYFWDRIALCCPG